MLMLFFSFSIFSIPLIVLFGLIIKFENVLKKRKNILKSKLHHFKKYAFRS